MRPGRCNINTALKMLMVLIGFSCQPPTVNKEAPALNELLAGGKFTVILPEDHRNGYTWNLSSGFDNTIVEQMNAVWHGNDKGIYFNFEALAAGQTTLSFINRNYNDTSEVKTFVLKILPR